MWKNLFQSQLKVLNFPGSGRTTRRCISNTDGLRNRLTARKLFLTQVNKSTAGGYLRSILMKMEVSGIKFR